MLLALAVSGTVTASASTLGGVRPAAVGANAVTVAKCDTNGIVLSYLNEFDALTETYRSVEVALGDVAPACDGLPFRLALASSSGLVREITGTLQLNGTARHAIALSPSISSSAITRTSLVVTG